MMTTERQAYLERMATCRPFQHFKIVPEWKPGEGDIEGFVHDEVVRQYHDTRRHIDGGVRVEWMLAAWAYAQHNAERRPDRSDVLTLGMLVEPQMNTDTAFRSVGVTIGGHEGAPPPLLGQLVQALAQTIVRPEQGREGPHADDYRRFWSVERFRELLKSVTTADDWYLAYEAVHPFCDGNGRTGKILHNWLLGTLDEPVLVADYFGGGNP